MINLKLFSQLNQLQSPHALIDPLHAFQNSTSACSFKSGMKIQLNFQSFYCLCQNLKFFQILFFLLLGGNFYLTNLSFLVQQLPFMFYEVAKSAKEKHKKQNKQYVNIIFQLHNYFRVFTSEQRFSSFCNSFNCTGFSSKSSGSF